MAKSGSPNVQRVLNDRAALDVFLDTETISRAELETRIGLSKPATAELLNRLEEAGFIEHAGRREGGPGPKAQLWRLLPTLGFVAGVDITARGIDIAVADLRGTTVAETFRPIHSGTSAVAQLVSALGEVCHDAGITPRELVHVSVGLPGSVDSVTGEIRYASGIDAWTGFDLPGILSQSLSVPVSIENDVNLVALNEIALGIAGDVANVVLIWIAESGLGSSVVVNGELLRGATLGAGEIGFTLIPDLEAVPGQPGYGRFGDIVAAESTLALAARHGIHAATALDAVERAVAGEAGGAEFLVGFARRIATGLTAAVSLLDPELIVLDGEICVAGGEQLCTAVSQELATLVAPRVRIVPGHDDASSVRAGAVQAALIPARERQFAAGSATAVPR